jgi:hypothetical protein
MVDMERSFVWAWDARPWPDFPTRLETWIDGANYDRGHWLNARLALPNLAEIVAEICERSGVNDLDLDDLYGTAKGYTIGAVESARQSLQPLMLTYGFDSFSRGAQLGFGSRSGRVTASVDADTLVRASQQPVLSAVRNANAAVPGKVALGFVRADQDYRTGTVEATASEATEPDVSQTSVPVVLSEGEARAIVERWLAEQRVARDTIEFAMPPSRLGVTAGDLVSLETGSGADLYRVDRIEEMGHRRISAVRVEPALYEVAVHADAPARAAAIEVPTPVDFVFLDLPLLRGDEVAHAPHIAVTRTPWAGSVAVYSSADDFGYVLNREILAPSVVGETLEPLAYCEAGLRSAARLRVRVASGRLQSVDPIALLNGANAAALRHGDAGDWEVLQFETAQLVGPGEYVLGGLLRGQAGTDGIVPPIWPIGTDFVLLDRGPVQIDMPQSVRGLERHYRIGPALRGYSDSSYRHDVQSFSGVGLRPYRPVHPVVDVLPGGAIRIRWTRRTRVNGDSWESETVPLGEEQERYRVVLHAAGVVVREVETSQPMYVYGTVAQEADGMSTALVAEIAQISHAYGPGPGLTVTLRR